MRFICVFALAARALFAQMEGSAIIAYGGGIANKQFVSTINLGRVLVSDSQYYWTITVAANGDKTFTFTAQNCVYATVINILGINIGTLTILPVCTPLSESAAENLGPIAAAMVKFIHVAPNAPHYWVYHAVEAQPHLTTVPPATPPDPSVIFFDGFSENLIRFDLATNTVATTITLPQDAQAYAVRPMATGVENEVWSVHGGTIDEVSIADLGTATVLATIPISTLDPKNSLATNLVFTNDGATALYAVAYPKPDSSGNLGALLTFDAVNRKLTGTTQLKILPTSLIMAPDGLTAYLIGSGKILYYDILSGTADLTATFPLNSVTFGNTAFGPTVFIHPDGTRLIFHDDTRGALGIFDLTTRKVTNEFPYNLPVGNAFGEIQMSQDGSTVTLVDVKGNVYNIDTRYGNISKVYQTTPMYALFPGPAGH